MKRNRTLTNKQQQDLADRRAAERRAAIAEGGVNAWRMPGRTIPNKRREASRKACRGDSRDY